MRINDRTGWRAAAVLAAVSAIGAGPVGQPSNGAGEAPPTAPERRASERSWLVVADFNQAHFRNNLGLQFGAWDRDPTDATQFCRTQLVESPRLGASGRSLRVDYDVQSPHPAYNGFWMKLPAIAARSVRQLAFAIKGDAHAGFTRRLKLELKDERRAAVYVLDGLQADWVRMHIPLEAFRDIEALDSLTEFVIVFDDRTVTRQTGTLYLEDVMLEYAR